MRLGIACGLALTALTAASVVQANLGAVTDQAGPTVYTRLSLELESRLQTRDGAQEAVVTLGPNGRDVRLWGELSEGTADRIAKVLEGNRGIERIHLTSEGGLVDEGEAIGRLIDRYGLITYVPDYCVSACTLAFVRGRERLIVANARLGFHAPYEKGLFGQDFEADSTFERAAYLAAGIEAAFVDTALRVHSEDLWIPDPDRLLTAHVATGIVDLRRFPDSTLDDGPDLDHARAAVLQNFSLLRGIAHSAPDLVDGIASWYLDAYRSGVSEDEVVATLKRKSARLIARTVRNADDGTVIVLGRSLARAMARTSDARSCVAIGEEADLVLAHDALRTSGDHDARKLMEEAAQHLSRFRIEPGEAAFPNTRERHADTRATDCEAMIQRYERTLALPRRAAAASIRQLMAPAVLPQPALAASAQP